MNADLSDIATGLSQSLATTGVSTMLAPLVGTAGNAGSPAFSFSGSTTTGFYLAGTNQIGVSNNGSQSATFNADGSVTFNGPVSFTGGITGAIPVGTVVNYAGSTIPLQWYLCYGQALSRTVFSALFTAIGTTYGAGDGSTTFNLPDYRGRVLAGRDDMGGSAAGRIGTVSTDSGTIVGVTLGSAGGSATHVQTTAELIAHNHTAADSGHTHTVTADDNTGYSFGVSGGVAGGFGLFTQPGGPAHSITSATGNASISVANTGSSNAMAWLQPTIIANKLIYAAA